MEKQNWAGPELDGEPEKYARTITTTPYWNGINTDMHTIGGTKRTQPQQVGSARLKKMGRSGPRPKPRSANWTMREQAPTVKIWTIRLFWPRMQI